MIPTPWYSYPCVLPIPSMWACGPNSLTCFKGTEYGMCGEMSPPELGCKKPVASTSGALAFSRERRLPCCEAALGRGPLSNKLRLASSQNKWAWKRIFWGLPTTKWVSLEADSTPFEPWDDCTAANTLIATLWKMLSQNHLAGQHPDALPVRDNQRLLFSSAGF